MTNYSEVGMVSERKFLPADFVLKGWPSIEPYVQALLDEPLESHDAYWEWMLRLSELEAFISEDLAWRYVNMTRDTANEGYISTYREFIQGIQPKLAPCADLLNRKVIESPFANGHQEPAFSLLLRRIEKDIRIFREENIPLQTIVTEKQQEYATLQAAMTINHEGKEITLQQASDLLQSKDRKLREEIYIKVHKRRYGDAEALNAVLSNLIDLRHRIALNAGFGNYRDYKFIALGRFDYTPQDCFVFHDAVKKVVVPLLDPLVHKRKGYLGVSDYRPWDVSVDPYGEMPLKPFGSEAELVETTIQCFEMVDRYFADCLRNMRDRGRLDLFSRKGKAPGGYNYPMPESGAPFIFMNATSTLRDMVTLLHEGGHAVHSFLTNDLKLNGYKEVPSEVAELASMSMELLTMDYWHLFFQDEKELNRAKYLHLEQIVQTLPWVATIDKFQHWMYENPGHTVEERNTAWRKVFHSFSDSIVDYTGLENYRDNLWQKQLHIFEVPFYYIEYGIAQLGAVAVWKNFKMDRDKTVAQYKDALSLGYTKSIPEIYDAAGIRFDFSAAYISELMDFVWKEMESIRL